MIKRLAVLFTILIVLPFAWAQYSSGGGGGGGTVAPTAENAITKELPLGKGLAEYFGTVIDHSDLSNLFDGTITWGGNSYDTSEALEMTDQNNPAVSTSLSQGVDDFKSNVYITTYRGKMVYRYRFDEVVNISTASTTNPITINFLGKILKITNVGDTDTFTAYLGDEASKTYNDGDAYAGENEINPDWVWAVNSLTELGTNQVLGVKNNFRRILYTDGPIGVGECYNFPNNRSSICFDGLTVADTGLKDYGIEVNKHSDLSQAIGSMHADIPTLYVRTLSTDGLELRPFTAIGTYMNETTTIKTGQAWLSLISMKDLGISTSTDKVLAVFYKTVSDSRVRYFGAVSITTGNGAAILRANHVNTKDNNAILKYDEGGSATNTLNLTWDINADSTTDLEDGADDIKAVWGVANGNFDKLGPTSTTEEAGELLWGSLPTTPIGAKDEDHRTRYGIIVKNPKSNSASERVLVQIPSDQGFARISIKAIPVTITPTPEPQKPSFSEQLTAIETAVANIRLTDEYSKKTRQIESILVFIERQVNKLMGIVAQIDREESSASSAEGTVKEKVKRLLRRMA